MGTSGIIAISTSTGWKGREHNYDSYPSGLGVALWNLYKGHCAEDIDLMVKILLEDHCGWSSIVHADFSLEPGYGRPPGQEDRPQCFCHGERSENLGWLYPKDWDSGYWLYVIDRDKREIDVYKTRRPPVRTIFLDEAEMPAWLEREE